MSASAIFFCPGIHWITEISPVFERVSESGYSGTQSVVLAFMDGSDCRMETERIDSGVPVVAKCQRHEELANPRSLIPSGQAEVAAASDLTSD